jgi:hypothetical protein
MPQPFGLSQSNPTRGFWVMRTARMLWAAPNTLIGLALGLLLLPLGARIRRVGGALEIATLRQPPRRPWPFAAITLGHVIVGTHAPARALGAAVFARLPAGGHPAGGAGGGCSQTYHADCYQGDVWPDGGR